MTHEWVSKKKHSDHFQASFRNKSDMNLIGMFAPAIGYSTTSQIMHYVLQKFENYDEIVYFVNTQN